MLHYGDHNSFTDLFSVGLRTIDHLNLKLRIFSEHIASYKIGVSKVREFGNFVSPMYLPFDGFALLFVVRDATFFRISSGSTSLHAFSFLL